MKIRVICVFISVASVEELEAGLVSAARTASQVSSRVATRIPNKVEPFALSFVMTGAGRPRGRRL
jgi:hypothetical protein